MRIYVLPAPSVLRPSSQPFTYPPHNQDFGVEQDFYRFLVSNRSLTISDPGRADWHYLPAYWTRWHLNNDYGKSGLDRLRSYVSRVVIDDSKTFTVCQYDDGPLIDLGETAQFLASRKSAKGIDIPLLSAPHKRPLLPHQKKFLASFVGRLSTHPIRQSIARFLKDYDAVYLYDGDRGSRFFVKTLLASYIALCPRGYGGGSFRFFEAMQLSVVPFLVGDLDIRPFKRFISWDECSFYSAEPAEILSVLESVAQRELLVMGKQAARVYAEKLRFGKWCEYVIRELEDLV